MSYLRLCALKKPFTNPELVKGHCSCGNGLRLQAHQLPPMHRRHCSPVRATSVGINDASQPSIFLYIIDDETSFDGSDSYPGESKSSL